MLKIYFVCHGNICRSPMAEFMFKEMVKNTKYRDSIIRSFATSTEEIGNDMHYKAKYRLFINHIPYESHIATQISKTDLLAADYLIVMDNNNINYLNYLFPTYDFHNVYKLMSFANSNADISDPWYTDDFETTYNEIQKGLEAFLHYLNVRYN